MLIVVLTALYFTYARHLSALDNLFFAGFVPAVAAIIVSMALRMDRNVLNGFCTR